jgi:hypothetical protein
MTRAIFPSILNFPLSPSGEVESTITLATSG